MNFIKQLLGHSGTGRKSVISILVPSIYIFHHQDLSCPSCNRSLIEGCNTTWRSKDISILEGPKFSDNNASITLKCSHCECTWSVVQNISDNTKKRKKMYDHTFFYIRFLY